MQKKSGLRAVAGTALLALSAGAYAGPITIEGFSGPYAPENWSSKVIGQGSVDTVGVDPEFPEFDTLGLVCEDSCAIELTIASNVNGTVGFSWDAVVSDPFFIAGTFEFVVNGAVASLASIVRVNDDSVPNPINLFGDGLFDIAAGDVFGFRLFTLGTDPGFGDLADVVISKFQVVGTVPVPEPGTLALIAAGLLGVGAMRRTRRAH